MQDLVLAVLEGRADDGSGLMPQVRQKTREAYGREHRGPGRDPPCRTGRLAQDRDITRIPQRRVEQCH